MKFSKKEKIYLVLAIVFTLVLIGGITLTISGFLNEFNPALLIPGLLMMVFGFFLSAISYIAAFRRKMQKAAIERVKTNVAANKDEINEIIKTQKEILEESMK
jgi:hypothetical protein